MDLRPLCFVLMPFGLKKDPATGLGIDFDQIYETSIRPGIEAAGLEAMRADEERTGGIIHKPMFERLMLCDYAVADLTTANANVFYELGVRHAVRPSTTLAIFASQHKLPFDVDFLRALPYRLGERNRFGADEASSLTRDLARRLEDLKQLSTQSDVTDSPVFQLLKDYAAPDIAHLKTDVFRNRARYEADIKRQLADARADHNAEWLHSIETNLGDIGLIEAGILVDLFLSYRAVSDYQGMISLYENLPVELKNTVMMREQFGFALNRLGRRDEAVRVLEGVLSEQGPSSETCGLLGRIFKDRWVEAKKSGESFLAEGYLDQAIDMYRRGFEADIRDAYPGINAVTLLEIKGDEQSLASKDELLPVVRFAVKQRLSSSRADYWDYATLLELAVLSNDSSAVRKSLSDALSRVREVWEPKTTANNLRLIQESRAARSQEADWLGQVIDTLDREKTL
ncbi:MAG: TRAFs-binding domain-containing protein [Gammaproteobacteria bacterium]|nr:TRAFs-binding domain-containing protein [Gammaproteobacteria bacterium]